MSKIFNESIFCIVGVYGMNIDWWDMMNFFVMYL